MIYSDFQGAKVSRLGFGAMRLPLLGTGNASDIDIGLVEKMISFALEHGINYFDTARPYHNGMSESVIGKTLSAYPRESFYLATKYPGHQISKSYNPAETFEEQLETCGVDYFDFYLLHNVNETSVKTYNDPKWGIVDYFTKQKKLGRIRHLGFSCHGSAEMLREFLDKYDGVFEFCQIQLNYLDWTLQDAKSKYELLTARGIPVWVMEPVRGGKLARFADEDEAVLRSLHLEESIAAWAFRWLQGLDNVKVILSGMSDMAQMVDNISTFEKSKPLSDADKDVLSALAKRIAGMIPCTGCRYCCDSCPQGLEIPLLISLYNDFRFASSVNIPMRMEAFTPDKYPAACIGCGNCSRICPQGINVPQVMKSFDAALSKLPTWTEICRQREEAAEKAKAAKA